MKNYVLGVILISFLLLNVMVISAVSNLNLEVNLVDNQKKEMDLTDIKIENQLVFKLILSNVGNYWICSNFLNYKLDITRTDGKVFPSVSDSIISSSDYKDKICFAPNSQFTLWIPYDDYNHLGKIQTLTEKGDRIGDWQIKPSISLGYNPNCYTTIDITKGSCPEELRKSIVGNPLNFNVRQENTSTHPELSSFKKWFDKFWWYWVLGIGAGILILIGIIKLFKRK